VRPKNGEPGAEQFGAASGAEPADAVRIAIRVRAGARSTSVGGTYDGALVVRVPEVPERGRATAAALRAVAEALGVRTRDVRLVAGGSSQNKTIEIDLEAVAGDGRHQPAQPAEQTVMRRVEELRHAGKDAQVSRQATPSGQPPATVRRR
jgi:uncharacterized protein